MKKSRMGWIFESQTASELTTVEILVCSLDFVLEPYLPSPRVRKSGDVQIIFIRRFPKISEGFRKSPKISDDFRRLPKISGRLPKITEGVQGFLTTSKPDSPTVFRRKKIEFLFNRLLSNYTHYCQLGVGILSECVRSISKPSSSNHEF